LSPSFDTLVDKAKADMSERPGLFLCEAWTSLDLGDVRKDLILRLREAGVEEAEIETRHLMRHALAPDDLNAALSGDVLVSWQQIAALADLAAVRLTRRPLSQVLGSQPFWTLDLKVSGDVLTPRSDTEALVEAVLARCDGDNLRLLDLGTGSGAILLALLSERESWTGLGVDLSSEALEIAGQNSVRCGLDERAQFFRGRWGTALEDHGFDIVVSNPPYIVREVLAGLEPEVRDFEPSLALDGGADGLDAYRDIISDMHRLLKPGGLFAFEIGYDQGQTVSALASDAGFDPIEIVQDLSGMDRIVLGRGS